MFVLGGVCHTASKLFFRWSLVEMFLNKKVLTTLLSMVVAMTILAVPHQAKAGRFLTKVCKKYSVRAAGTLRLDRYLGKVSARIYWRGKVKRRYGWKYAAWSLARNKRVRCSLRKKGFAYRCVVRARPCTLIRSRHRRRGHRR